MKNVLLLLSLLYFTTVRSSGQCILTVISSTPATPGYCDGSVVIHRIGCGGVCTYLYDANSPNAIYNIGPDTIYIDSLCAGSFNFAMNCDSGVSFCQTWIQYTGVPEVNGSLSVLQVYSDPVNHVLEIGLPGNAPENSAIQILSQTGRVLRRFTPGKESRYRISTKDFAPGIYLISLESGVVKAVQKFIVLKTD